jgi:hypothetical protein
LLGRLYFKDSRAENGGVMRGLWVEMPGLRVFGGVGKAGRYQYAIKIMPLNP